MVSGLSAISRIAFGALFAVLVSVSTVASGLRTQLPQLPANQDYLFCSSRTSKEASRLWREAVEQHESGKWDTAAVTVWSWSASKISCAIIVQKPSDEEIVERGALFHTDIALLAPAYIVGNSEWTVFRVNDGLAAGTGDDSHWSFARKLLDKVSDTNRMTREWIRQWYIATSALMQRELNWGSAYYHLNEAHSKYPSDPVILFYTGVMHEVFAGPEVQLAKRELIGSEEQELQLARRFLQESVTADPAFPEARLHLGRVLGLLGNHSSAATELLQAASAIKDPQLMYHAALFLGQVYAALGRDADARRQYETAAQLYPNAASPLFGLSELASRGGDPAASLLFVKQAITIPVDGSGSQDPWWNYHIAHVRNAYALMTEMRKAFGGIPR